MRKELTNSQYSKFKCIICKEVKEFVSIGNNHRKICLYFIDKFNFQFLMKN